jgi:hypothetical protein
MIWQRNRFIISAVAGCTFAIVAFLFLHERNSLQTGASDRVTKEGAKSVSKNKRNPTTTSTRLTKEDYEVVKEIIETSEYSIIDKRKVPLGNAVMEETLQGLIEAYNFSINLDKIKEILGDKKCETLPQELQEKVVLLFENIAGEKYQVSDETLPEKYKPLYQETVLSDKEELKLAQYYAMENDSAFRTEVSDWHKFKFYVSAFYKEFDRLERQMLEDKVGVGTATKIDEIQLNLIYSKELTGSTEYGI